MNKTFFKKLINISSPILITGETGTGKSKTAKRLFDLSDIYKEKFLTVHLASLKEELIESELFGHRKGSFTGATENKNGYLMEAGKGTLFLDEIGELSLEAQKKLLYLLEEKKFTPVGSTSAITFEGRLIMATNKNLKKLVQEGQFRADLYYRLIVFHFELAPLKSNREKLHATLLRLFETQKNHYAKPTLSLKPELVELLLNAPWNGNYRELKNCLEYMVVMAEALVLGAEALPPWFSEELPGLQAAEKSDEFIAHFPGDYGRALEKFESLYLKARLEGNEGRVNETARTIGMSKATLISKARKYGIDTLTMRAEAGRQKALKTAA